MEAEMHREILDQPYRIVVNAEQKYNPRSAGDVMGYSVRVTIDRVDRKPVQGALLTEHSDEMAPLHGDHFKTVEAALDHGEAWGRHCIAQWGDLGAH
jgi:hypothetical protein